MKRNKMLSLCLAGCVALSVSAATYAEPEEPQKEVKTETEAAKEKDAEAEEPKAEASNAEEAAKEAAEKKARTRNYAKIGEQMYSFPVPYKEFVEKGGWEVVDYYKDQEKDMLSADSYTYFGLQKDGSEITVYLINFDINETAMEDCYVGGFEADASYNFDVEALPVFFPGKIKLGESNLKIIQKLYGLPSDTYEADDYTKLTYENEDGAAIEFLVNRESGILETANLRYFTAPEDFKVGEVSKEKPEIVTAYKAPKALTDDFVDPVVEYFGDLYQLPAPISAFTANGWVLGSSISEDEPVEYIPGNGVVAADMSKENQTVRVYLYNDTPNAILYENAMVHELGFYTYDSESIAMKLSGGVVLGADADELMALAKENEYYVNDEMEDGYLTVSKTEEDKYDKYVEFWIDTEEDATAVAGFSVHCEGTAE